MIMSLATANTGYPSPLDRQRSLDRLGGDEALLRDMAGFFLEDAPLLMQQVQVALGRRETREAGIAAHSLKGLAATFDAEAVLQGAGQIEQHCQRGELEQAQALTAPLERDLETLLVALKEVAVS